ncbi:MAG: tRNA dihydrouridine synthase DusB [Candidatus Latescibacterota bacterium]|nr:tRNA dihydrouridine synthase DusB [Candidatus Latescibacterota bacterium]
MAVSIGGVEINGFTVLAPLAGVTDRAFRDLCREQGASVAVTEMVSAKGLADGTELSSEYLDFDDREHPISVQMFGSEPDSMAEGARVIAERKPDLIDINCGCPVKKIVNRNAGAALMKDPSYLGKIISAMVCAVDVPISLKIRSGWDENENAAEVACAAENAGASAIAVHARSRADKFSGQADWDVISRVKNAVRIPVIGNGDVRDPVAAKEMLSTTGCDMVMVGRWAIGNPWIFGQIEQYLDDGRLLPDPTVSERMKLAIRHLHKSIEAKGPKKGIYELRRSLAAYIRGLPGAKEIKPRMMTEEDPDRLAEMLSALSIPEDQKEVVV